MNPVRHTLLRRGAAAVLLAVVIGAPAAASWHGLTAAGEHAFGLTGGTSALVPLVLDAAGAYAAVLALRDVLAGDGGAVNRMLVWAYALGSAALNVWYAESSGLTAAAALFFGSASVSSVILWDRTLRALRRDNLRAKGAVQNPTPRFRAARWLVAPRETRRAWCLAVVEGVTDPREAVRLARTTALPAVPAVVELVTGADVVAVSHALEQTPAALSLDVALTAGTKADAIRSAFGQLDSEDPQAVVAWLADHGVIVTPTYVADVIRRDADKPLTPGRPQLRITA